MEVHYLVTPAETCPIMLLAGMTFLCQVVVRSRSVLVQCSDTPGDKCPAIRKGEMTF